MPYYPIKDRDMRFTEAKSLVGTTVSSGSQGISGSAQILNTPGYSPDCPAININSNTSRGALERIPGTEGFVDSLAGFTPIYPGGRYSALHPYDEVRVPQRLALQSSSFLSTDVEQTTKAQQRAHIQNVWMPEYTAKYGPRYDNKVENKQTLWLSRPVMSPAWGFDSSRGTNYELETGFSSFAWVNVHQDDIGFSTPTSSSVNSGNAPDVALSKGLSPVLTVLSSSWASFTTGTSLTNADPLNGQQVPYACFSWGIHRDNSGNRRIYVMAATGTSQSDVYVTQSNPVTISTNEWNHVGVRWQQDVNNRTGSFVLNGTVIGEFVLDEARIFTPSDSNGRIWPTTDESALINKPLLSSSAGFANANFSGSIDGIITLGNLGNQRYLGSTDDGRTMPLVSGSAKLIELHDVAMWNSFIELEYIEPYQSGTVARSGSAEDPVFYMPVATPYAGQLRRTSNGKPMYEFGVSNNFVNPLPYYGRKGPSNFVTTGSQEIPLEEAHLLSLAQLGVSLGDSGLGQSTLDKLALSGTIPGSMFENINAGFSNGVKLDSSKSPVVGCGGAWAVSLNTIDVATGNPSLSTQIASGTIEGANRFTAIPFSPMDYITAQTSASFGISNQRVWPSNHHSFNLDARNLNSWASSSHYNSILSNVYSGSWGFRKRFDAAKTRRSVEAITRTVTYTANTGSVVLDPLSGSATKIDHFANTAFNTNAVFYIPKVIAGDNLDKGTFRAKFMPSVYDNVDGEEIVKFGSFTVNGANSHGNIEVNDFTLDFVDNGYGGLVRAPFESPAPNEQFSIFYDRGTVVQKHPALFWVGQPVEDDDRQFWTLHLTSSNRVFVREVEMNLPKNKATIPFSSGSKDGTITGADIYDKSGNLIEKVRLGQPVERLSGSAITLRTFTVF